MLINMIYSRLVAVFIGGVKNTKRLTCQNLDKRKVGENKWL